MECHNHSNCNRKLVKIMKQIKNEIIQVDKFLQEHVNSDKTLCCNPTKNEKKQIINIIKAKSVTLCVLIDELRIHRTEVKYLIKCFNNLFSNYQKLNARQKSQLDKIESIHCYIKNELPRLMNNQIEKSSHLDKFQTQKKKDLELQRTFETIISEYNCLSEKVQDENKNLINHLNHVTEDCKRDQQIYSTIIKNIRTIFDLKVKIEGKKIKFIDYAFPETETNIDEHAGKCCNA